MGAMIRSYDWSSTPLGAAAGWPSSLRTALGIMLESSVPMAIAWGPELRLIYNDRYRLLLGARHPDAFGQPVTLDDRNMSYTPIRDESGAVGGVLAIYTEPAIAKPRAVFEATELAELTAEIAGQSRAAIERAGLELVLDCPRLPDPVFVDRGMWEQLVRSLVSNAAKMTSHGKVRVSLRHAGDHVELLVRDTGRGLPVDEPTRITALELARIHGGTVEVASELGAGTTFTVRVRTGRAHVLAEQLAVMFDVLGHDLRNPLNAITTTAQLLVRRATTPDIARPASRIVLSADRMARMITQLIDLARVRTAGGLKLQPRPIDIGELAQLVIDDIRNNNPEAKIDVTTTGALHGRWDGGRLAQLFANLAINAIDHGEPRTPVHVVLDGHDPAQVSIRFENRGQIAPEILPALFDPFRGAEQRSEIDARARARALHHQGDRRRTPRHDRRALDARLRHVLRSRLAEGP